MNWFKFLKRKKPEGIYSITPKDMTEEMARKYLHEEMEALREMESQKRRLEAMTQANYITSTGLSASSGSTWTDSGSIAISGSGSQYLTADGSTLTWSGPSPTNYIDSRVQYIAHLYNMVYEAENCGKKEKVENAFWALETTIREAFADEVAAVRVGRKLNRMLEKLAELTLDREYLKEERFGPIMGDEENHDEFNREQTILNRLVENYIPKEARSLTVYNKKEREMFMKDITQISNCVRLIVSDKKGDQNAGKELIKSLAVG